LAWKIEYDRRVLKELKSLDKTAQKQILKFFDDLPPDPTEKGKPLKANFSGLWRYRIGEYRAVCRIENDTLTVLVLRIAHRKEVYKKSIRKN